MKKKKLIAAAGLLCAVAVGGTFAYFSQTLTATNEFDTGSYDTELVEKFKPSEGENWEPGTNVNKDVTFQNTGTLPVVVRAKFEELWESKDSEDGDSPLYYIDTTENKDKLAVGTPSDAQNKFENVYQSDPDDGYVGEDLDDSVVFKQMNTDGGWVYNPDDGYYYYTSVLQGVGENGEIDETTKLLDSVTLAEIADMGYFRETKWYATTTERPASDSDDWIEFATVSDASAAEGYSYVSTSEMNETLEAEGLSITYMKSSTELVADATTGVLRSGYSNAEYTLIISAETVQATKSAVEEVFGTLDYAGLGLQWDLTDENVINE